MDCYFKIVAFGKVPGMLIMARFDWLCALTDNSRASALADGIQLATFRDDDVETYALRDQVKRKISDI